MKKAVHVAILLGLFSPALAFAQTTSPVPDSSAVPAVPQDTFFRGEVIEVIEEKFEDIGIVEAQPFSQVLKVRVLSGPQAGSIHEVSFGAFTAAQKLTAGDKVVVVSPDRADPNNLYIFDRYRLTSLLVIFLLFLIVILFLARTRGLMALLGLVVSVAVLTLFVVPQIMAGRNPLVVSLVGSLVIAAVSIYLAHGFSRRTTVALAGTLLTITIAITLAVLFVKMSRLQGTGSEEAYYLQLAPIARINLQGLLLGGIIIGALGVLDDITTAQAAAVQEISRANPALTRRELFARGFSVGQEHITSLVNTLVLAYAGASFPALLLFTVYQRPWWVVMNTELIAEEIVRTLVGSIALMCAVPITTFLAAYYLRASAGEKPLDSQAAHSHAR